MGAKLSLDLNKFEVNRPKTFFRLIFYLATITMKKLNLSWHRRVSILPPLPFLLLHDKFLLYPGYLIWLLVLSRRLFCVVNPFFVLVLPSFSSLAANLESKTVNKLGCCDWALIELSPGGFYWQKYTWGIYSIACYADLHLHFAFSALSTLAEALHQRVWCTPLLRAQPHRYPDSSWLSRCVAEECHLWLKPAGKSTRNLVLRDTAHAVAHRQ